MCAQEIDTDAVAPFVQGQLGQGVAHLGVALGVVGLHGARWAVAGAEDFAALRGDHHGDKGVGFLRAGVYGGIDVQGAAAGVAAQLGADGAIQAHFDLDKAGDGRRGWRRGVGRHRGRGWVGRIRRVGQRRGGVRLHGGADSVDARLAIDPIQILLVARQHGAGGAKFADAPLLQPQAALAKQVHMEQGVRAQQQGGAVFAQLHDAVEGAFGEHAIAHGEGFIDDEDVGLDTGGHRKRQAHLHAAGVGFDGHGQVLAAQATEGADGIQPRADLGMRQAHGGGVEEDVFDAGGFGVEARAQLQQGGDAPLAAHLPAAGGEGAGGQLQQGGFARTVEADDAHRLAGQDVKADGLQGGVAASL